MSSIASRPWIIKTGVLAKNFNGISLGTEIGILSQIRDVLILLNPVLVSSVQKEWHRSEFYYSG